ncbi:hypothetical protein BCR35DRAFT_301941 [Leucosporidium creatinivorum]|uniref:RBR-type E3 ubiquitin transferase n=1 Tax=Leucosporidium creatinivorum TaxID=106004 RepID=A0A1Y2FVM7_9BASI|nr:hypothetical protein BCR35DRAFT_301941 [Leucosporidium creatinivorum]
MASENEIMTDISDDDYSDAFDPDEDMEAEFDDASSISDSGFSPIEPDSHSTGKDPKGKGKAVDSMLTLDNHPGASEKLKEEQKVAVAYVEEMLQLKSEQAAVLLRYFAWKKEKLVETYMDSPESTLAAAGIHENGAQPRLKRVRGFVCEVCYDEMAQETLALSCDHRFCKSCYAQYVTSKVVDEGESRRIQCMGSKCNVIVDEKTVELLVEEEVLERYRSLLNRTYVDDSTSLRWCPAPNCDYALKCHILPRQLDSIIPTVQCSCLHTFCFGCGDADHRPCCCPIVRRWLKKCADDSETSNWISANTKECTKCHSTIEKNGGCNHMTCKSCKWEFCWVCMGPWSEHGTAWYNCSRYEEKGGDAVNQDAQSKSRASLERYLHYYNRFANHEQSIKLEHELATRMEKKMEEMQEHSSLSWIEVQFLAKAVETLTKCRTVLKWTYAMAFYLAKNNHTAIFEDNQADLEQAVEGLSELLEKPLDEEKIAELRQQTTDKTVYVSKRCQILLDDTLRGYEEDRWHWAEAIKM